MIKFSYAYVKPERFFILFGPPIKKQVMLIGTLLDYMAVSIILGWVNSFNNKLTNGPLAQDRSHTHAVRAQVATT